MNDIMNKLDQFLEKQCIQGINLQNEEVVALVKESKAAGLIFVSSCLEEMLKLSDEPLATKFYQLNAYLLILKKRIHFEKVKKLL